jgi:hypothetical protein
MSRSPAELAAAIDEHPDLLHGDWTPAAQELAEHGLAALPHVLPLLEVDEEMTRLRAQRVLEAVTRAWVRERVKAPTLTRADTHAWQKLWERNGAYDWKAPVRARAEAVARWRAWVAKPEP